MHEPAHLNHAIELLVARYEESNIKHPKPYNSYHEGLGLLLEELHELQEQIFRKEADQNPAKIQHEACDCANVAIKMMILAEKHRLSMLQKEMKS
ncbi:MAG: hypothetical protein HQM10_26590 [Candidatus Riflebacteria bacterium]|nr:hypothetical protein [Candidatus Riflebacteria bacterium]